MQVEEKEEVQSNEKLCTSLFIVGRKCYLCFWKLRKECNLLGMSVG